MSDKERHKKFNDLISKFPNGREKYNESAIFRKVVDIIFHGGNEYEMIEKLCDMHDENQKTFEEYVMRDTRPFTVTGIEIDEMGKHYGE